MEKLTKRKLIFLFFPIYLFLTGCTGANSNEIQQTEIGRLVFADTCAACHGEQGEGHANEYNAPALDESEHAWHHPDQEICNWIVNGKSGFTGEMPSFGDQLSDEEVQAVIKYLHSLWGPSQLTAQQDVTARWPNHSNAGCPIN